MTGAMYAGISGLKTHMQNLNVIGHNLANVNTYGYKTQRMIFRESLYGTKVAGSDGTLTRGGVNPSQIGYGVEVGTIDLNMASSEIISTYVYKQGLINGDYSFSTAVGLFNTVINVILLISMNAVVKKMNDGKGI